MHTSCMVNEGIDVRALRATKGWTQDQMAEYLGIDRSSVSRIENGAEVSGPVLRLLVLLKTEADHSETAPSEAGEGADAVA